MISGAWLRFHATSSRAKLRSVPRGAAPPEQLEELRNFFSALSRGAPPPAFAKRRNPRSGSRSAQARETAGCVSSAGDAKKRRKRNECFAKRSERFRDRGRKSLKSLGREISDFAEPCVFKDLTAISFRAFSRHPHFRPQKPGAPGSRTRESAIGGAAMAAAGSSMRRRLRRPRPHHRISYFPKTGGSIDGLRASRCPTRPVLQRNPNELSNCRVFRNCSARPRIAGGRAAAGNRASRPRAQPGAFRLASSARTAGATTVPRSSIERRIAACG